MTILIITWTNKTQPPIPFVILTAFGLGLVVTKNLTATIIRIDVPTLLIVLSLQFLDIVTDIACDTVIVYLKESSYCCCIIAL